MGRNRIINNHQSLPFSTTDTANAAGAANTAATVTYAAFPAPTQVGAVGNQPIPAGYPVPAAVAHVITGFRATVDATVVLNAVPSITIRDGAIGSSNIVYSSQLQPVPTALSTGPVFYVLEEKFDIPKRGTAGNPMTLTIPAAGSTATAKLVVLGHWTEIA